VRSVPGISLSAKPVTVWVHWQCRSPSLPDVYELIVSMLVGMMDVVGFIFALPDLVTACTLLAWPLCNPLVIRSVTCH
jgi:hypothetical protein